MKLTLNLSSRTFVNRRALYGIYTLLTVALGLLLVLSLVLFGRAQMQLRQARGHLAELEQAGGGARMHGVGSMSSAAYEKVLERIHFANEVLAQDNFSWTDLLNHLEEVVPEKVAVSGIHPDYKERSLRIVGVARGVSDLREFLDNLSDSPYFKEVYLLQQGRVERSAAAGAGISYSIVVREAF